MAADLVVYDDFLRNGFEDWSWATHDLACSLPVAAGSHSISMEPDAWQGVFLHAGTPIDLAGYTGVRFQLHGGPDGGQLLRLYLELDGSFLAAATLDPAPARAWQQHTVLLADMGLTSGWFDGLVFQDNTGGDQAEIYLDQIELLEGDPPQPVAIAVVVDPDSDRRAISPWVYGVNFGDDSQLTQVPFPLRRWGGNATTRYSWRNTNTVNNQYCLVANRPIMSNHCSTICISRAIIGVIVVYKTIQY